jgi:hypothetical protein
LNLTRKGQKALTRQGFVPLAYRGRVIAYATAPGRTAAIRATKVGLMRGRSAKEHRQARCRGALHVPARGPARENREIGQDPGYSASTLPEVYLRAKNPNRRPSSSWKWRLGFRQGHNADPAVLKTYLDRYPDGAFATAAQALIAQQEQRLKAEAAAREEPK